MAGRPRAQCLAASLLAVLVGCGNASTPPRPREQDPSSRDGYEGRPIASTCSYLGAEWLDRPERAEREQPDKVIAALAIAPGSTVADVGAGTGYFTVRLARAVGATGHVIAT